MDGDVLPFDVAQNAVVGGGLAALIVLRLQAIDGDAYRADCGIEAQDSGIGRNALVTT